MPETAGSGEPPDGGDEISWRRAGEFLRNILTLERSVRNLRRENLELRTQVDELQRLVDDHNGQLKMLAGFVQSSLADKVESAAETAALNAVQRFIRLSRRSIDETAE